MANSGNPPVKADIGVDKDKEYVEFLVGRNGDFDRMAASAVRSAKVELDYGNSELVYVAEKQPKNIAELESYYDRAEVCSEAANAHFKAAIQTRNKAMVERSDMVICCIEHNSGGAYTAVKYAIKLGKKVFNVAEDQE